MGKPTIKSILAARHYLIVDKAPEDGSMSAYYNAFLLANFGVIVDRPHMLTREAVNVIADTFKLNVPAGFYDNPQHMAYFSKSELLVEQLVSYFLVETGTGIYSRPEIFEKDLLEYKVGNEIKLREFRIVDAEEAVGILKGICDAFCGYTRPFSLDELAEFEYLFVNGYYTGKEIKCRDNIFVLLKHDATFARFLDKKDMVKLSVASFGDRKEFRPWDEEKLNLIKACLPYVRNCPMSKKQAKYYNKLLSYCKVKGEAADNARSPYRLAKIELDKGNVLGAAEIFARNGSLLERNIKFLLSRANPADAVKIIDMLPAKNPMALYQMVSTLLEDGAGGRTFSFVKNNKMKRHIETEYEAKWRKSRLNDATKAMLHDVAFGRIKDAYKAMGKLGKVYISDAFKSIGVPMNTSAGGKGIDVLPTGSRIVCPFSKIRTFVYWDGIRDVDASLVLVRADGGRDRIYFGNYASKPFGLSILFSGDCRSSKGAEYYDIDLDELREKGYEYVLYTINGFGDTLNRGETFCGYQNKKDLKTRAWDPKNIAMQFRVFGDSAQALAFGIDLKSNEVVVLNLVRDAFNKVMDVCEASSVEKYMKSGFLELNMGLVAACRGEVVTDPAEADVVFDDSYMPLEGQKVVRTYDLEKLAAIANGGEAA